MLYWLPMVQDWRSRIAYLERQASDEGSWNALQDLAAHQLTGAQTERLDRVLLRLFGNAPPPWLASRPVRVALLGSSTVSHLLPFIRIAGLRHGLWVTAFTAEYGQYRQVLLEEGGDLARFEPTVCILALDGRHVLAGTDPALTAKEAEDEVERVIDDLRSLWRRARHMCSGQVIQQTMLPVFADMLGQNEQRFPGSRAAMVGRVNERLRQEADGAQVDLLTVDSRSAVDGLDHWYDPRLWNGAKQEVSLAAASSYGALAIRLVDAQQGRSAKCLILDLDNTLWGGVVGDDGMEGVVLGQGSAVGEAFLNFQRYCLALTRRGVLLAVCSKNDEANVFAMLDQHPEMVLRREHLSVIVANWQDKAANIRTIAETLNIGLDALVFADDNPFERNLVRQELPQVRVPELPDDPALFARCLSDAGYFEALTMTAEDRARTDQYAANRDRSLLLADATDMAGYLRSLDMRLRWKRFDTVGLKRIVQLINKTNQFNLTTRRYTQEEIENVLSGPGSIGLQFRLLDRFGDNGTIAVVIGRLRDGDRLELDSWLMSCRVLGRRVEEAVLQVVMDQADSLGATRLLGCFRATAKNMMVADLYPRLGFDAIDETPEEASVRWFTRDLASADFDLPLTIERD